MINVVTLLIQTVSPGEILKEAVGFFETWIGTTVAAEDKQGLVATMLAEKELK